MGGVLQTMWLMAEELGLGLQVVSVFSAGRVEDELRRILSIPEHLKIAFACRIGHPVAPPGRYLRVRREVGVPQLLRGGARLNHAARHGGPSTIGERPL